MKKSIIISGPAASGKSWIASAIEKTHPKIGLRTTANGLIDGLRAKYLPRQDFENRSLVIVDECTKENIVEIDMKLRTFLIDEFGSEQYPIVYLSQENLTNQDFSPACFHIIHCRNAHIYNTQE